MNFPRQEGPMNMRKAASVFVVVVTLAGCGGTSSRPLPASTRIIPAAPNTYDAGSSLSQCDYVSEAVRTLSLAQNEFEQISDKLVLGQSFSANASNIQGYYAAWTNKSAPSGLEAVRNQVNQLMRDAGAYASALVNGRTGETEANTYLRSLAKATEAIQAAQRLYNCR